MAFARLAEEVEEVLRLKAGSPKVVPLLSTVVVWCSPDQRLSRQSWLVFVWFPRFSCSPAILLAQLRLSREIQGILAVARMPLVVAAHATGRKRFLTYPHRTGWLTSGSANLVLSMGGRLEVVQNSGTRTFKQETWSVCVVFWRCAASDHCIRKPFFCFPSCTDV